MCAIFGSKSFETFKSLYQANINRGQTAFGAISRYYTNPHSVIRGLRLSGQAKLLTPEELPPESHVFVAETVDIRDDYHVGHTQAPTSSAQIFDTKTSHPFVCYDWVVAHNGVLTNYDVLIKGLNKDQFPYNVVDSSIIPALLEATRRSDNKETPAPTEIETITKVLSQLEGTHSTWIYNRRSSTFYLARCGSTLFANIETGDFSSVSLPGMEGLSDGALYKYSRGHLIHAGEFKSKSPFFIL